MRLKCHFTKVLTVARTAKSFNKICHVVKIINSVYDDNDCMSKHRNFRMNLRWPPTLFFSIQGMRHGVYSDTCDLQI